MIEHTVKVILIILGYLLVLISLIPLIRNDNWMFRIFEYPRAQKLLINFLLIGSFFFLIDLSNIHDIIFIGLLSTNCFYLLYQIWPYTRLSPPQLQRIKKYEHGEGFRLLIFNVYQDNHDIESCLHTIEKYNPDLILLVETDTWWQSNLDKRLLNSYAYKIAKPLSNTYGIMLYSKFKLNNSEIRYLIEDDIPSIHTDIELPSGEIIKLYGLHPKPPVPNENARSTERDAEILLVAKEAKNTTIPVIVAGDLNDVAWSYSTELFLKVSGLLDPRRGRGFFNTYHAHHCFLRWPLDHVFVSKHFQLVDLQRLPAIGSDHFPILVDLVLQEEKSSKNNKEILPVDAAEIATANHKIEKSLR